MKLLIVDDEPVIVRGLLRLLDYESMGFDRVLSATDSRKALTLLREERPEVMLADVEMPNLSGLELLKLIRQEELPTRVLFLSGYRNFEYAQSALSLGAQEYLVKPVDAEKLSQVLIRIGGMLDDQRVDTAFHRRLNSLSHPDAQGNTAVLPENLPVDNGPFCFVCFHLNIPQENSVLSSGLLHFSALGKGEAYLLSQHCVAFAKNDYLCAVVPNLPQEPCDERAQRLAEACAHAVQSNLAYPFCYAVSDVLHTLKETQAAYERCVMLLNAGQDVPAQQEIPLIDRVKSYLAQHYGENLTLEVLSGKFSMNPSYFSSFFHQKTGVRYKDYLTHLRMNEAKKLLMRSDLLVYEVAQKVGYSDIRHFSSTFTKLTGVKPKDYRGKK
ncbi:MAG TPA: response regulator [Candidatus Limiplasma sp.]|nr:response regulator [Candidatus Limiplasma sp.]